MPPPRPPSEIEPLVFPVFGMSWYGDPADGRSIVAFCGGGGSARTGIHNAIVVQDGSADERKINTHHLVGFMLQVYANPASKRLWMVVALGGEVHRYSVPDGVLSGVLSVEEAAAVVAAQNPAAQQQQQQDSNDDDNDDSKKKPAERAETVRVNATADRLAVGLESGLVHVYATSDEEFIVASNNNSNNGPAAPLFVCRGHSKAVCDLQFSLRQNLLVSSARDGTARVWDATTSNHRGAGGRLLQILECDVSDPDGPLQKQPKRGRRPLGPGQVTVKACAFLDVNGQHLVTVASGRRGRAFLSRWSRGSSTQNQHGDDDNKNQGFQCVARTPILPAPASSLSLSQCGELLALGGCDGTVVLFDVPEWKPVKQFFECHDLPVTCIAARPYPVALQGEEESGIAVHARSASADSKLARLTLQKRVPKNRNDYNPNNGGICRLLGLLLHRLLQLAVLAVFAVPLWRDATVRCQMEWRARDIPASLHCVWENVLVAPSSRAGVAHPPY